MYSTISAWLQHTFHDNAWVIEIISIVSLTVLTHFFISLVIRRVQQRLENHHSVWDVTLLQAASRPVSFLIWLLGISIAAQVAGPMADRADILHFITIVRQLGSLFIISWFALRVIRYGQAEYLSSAEAKQKPVDKTLVLAVSQLLHVTVIISTALIAMQIYGLGITPLLTLGGVGGAGVVFAAKDLLANFFGGLIIYLDQPFKIGDWIKSPDKSIEGTVEHIGWRVTCIRTFDKRPLYVPNGLFLTISVENPSRMSNRRIKTNVGVRYQDANKIAGITDAIKAMLREHPEIDKRQTLIVNLVNFAPSSLEIMVYTFTKTTNWVKFQEIQQDVFLRIIEIIEARGAECAFPTQTVHLPDGLSLTREFQNYESTGAHQRSLS